MSRQVFKLCLVASLCGLLLGCKPYERVLRDDWAQFADDIRAGGGNVKWGGGQEGESTAEAYLRQRRGNNFTVYLAAHEGEDRNAAAFRDATWLRGQGGISDVWYSDDAEAGIAGVYAGRFSRADDPYALRIVQQAKALTRADETPFADAQVVSIQNDGSSGATDLRDLRTHAGQAEFTLQIGAFLASFPGDRRAAAENWVDELRTEDPALEAFYYHGPHRSMVTVGLFTEADRVWVNSPTGGQVRGWGPKIKAMQERFPHNVVNGMTVKEKNANDGKELGEQESLLVRIPR